MRIIRFMSRNKEDKEMKYIIAAAVIVPAVLLAIANIIGGVMWDLADSMPLWWEGEMEDEK